MISSHHLSNTPVIVIMRAAAITSWGQSLSIHDASACYLLEVAIYLCSPDTHSTFAHKRMFRNTEARQWCLDMVKLAATFSRCLWASSLQYLWGSWWWWSWRWWWWWDKKGNCVGLQIQWSAPWGQKRPASIFRIPTSDRMQLKKLPLRRYWLLQEFMTPWSRPLE